MLYNTRIFLVVVGILALAVSGCGKKKSPEAPVPKTEEPAPSAAKQDVFDEFYQEDGAAGKKQEKSAATFSTTTAGSKKKSSAKSQPVTHAASAGSVSAAFVEDGRYVVQVGTMASAAEADRRVQSLKSQGYPAYSAEVSSPTPAMQGTYYRVRIGGFASVAAAKNFGEEAFGSNGYWVDNKSNDRVGMEGYGLGSSQGAGTSYPSAGSSTPTPAASDWGSTPSSSSATSTPKKAPASASSAPPAWEEPPASAPAPAPAAAVKPAPVAQPAASSSSSDWGSPAPAPKPAPAPASSTPKPAASSSSSDWGSSTPAAQPAPAPAPAPQAPPAQPAPSSTKGSESGTEGWGSTDDAGW